MTETTPKSDLAIFFDIGNVLLDFNPQEAARKIAWALSRHPINVIRYFASSKLVDSIERGQLAPDKIYAIFRDDLGFKGSYKDFVKLWCGQFKLNRRSAALLKLLASRHRVYLLSNTNSLHYEHIRRRYAFARQAHGAVLSYELGLRKPEPAIYWAALKLAGVEPAQAVFIDDLKDNVEAARKIGIRVIHHVPGTDLRRELAALGVL